MKLIVKQSLLTLVSCILVTACTATNDDETRELPVSAPEAVGMSSDRLSKVDEVVERYIDEGRVHGVVIAVTRRGQVVYHKAHGAIDDTTGRTMQLDSLFHMASSTKQILGVAAMMAIEDGLFSPDDPVEKYIPEFKGIQVAVSTAEDAMNYVKKKDVKHTAEGDEGGHKQWTQTNAIGDKDKFQQWDQSKTEWDKNKPKQSDKGKTDWDKSKTEWTKDNVAFKQDKKQFAAGKHSKPQSAYRLENVLKPLTIHDLLTHTAGLQTGGIGTSVAGLDRPGSTDSLATWIPKVAKGPLDFQPGTRWAYSGEVGLDVVARIIEITSETPFNEFVKQRIFVPLDMKDTHWNIPDEKTGRLPRFSYDKERFITSPYYFSGSIGLVSTARDFMHFHQMLVNGGSLFGQQLLMPTSLDLMSTDMVGKTYQQGKKGAGRGFGYTVNINLDPEISGDGSPAGSFGFGGTAGTVSWSAPSEELTLIYMVQFPTDLPGKISTLVTDAIID